MQIVRICVIKVVAVHFLGVLILGGLADCRAEADILIPIPESEKVEHVDEYHGVAVADPYRWLEEDVRESKRVEEWVAAQNKATFAYLESIPQRESIEQRLTRLWNYEKFGSPFKAGGRYYYFHNSGLQNQSVLFTQEALQAKPRVLIDPNLWSKDGTVALAGTAFSDDGKHVAYGVQDGGSDWRTWRIMDIDTGKILEDELEWLKFSGVSWTKDGKGLFYSRYDKPKEESQFQGVNLNQKIYYHCLGTEQEEDQLVYHRPDHPDWGYAVEVTEDGDYLVITVWKGTDDKYRVLIKDLKNPQSIPFDLIDNFQNEYSLVGNDGTRFFFKTDLDAPMKRLVAIDLSKPEESSWEEILPETENVMRSVSLVGNMFLASYLKDAQTQVVIYSLEGALITELELPGIGTASGFGGKRTDLETFYSFSSFAVPPSIYRLDLTTRNSEQLRRSEVPFDPSEYVTEQVFLNSKDGTRLPMFLTHQKSLQKNGKNPVLLYGYGGFNIPLTPQFSISRLAWMEMGGVLAVANLRGGGEYGEKWHRAGTKLEKQNVFDDFIAAAEWLIEKEYTKSSRLAIQGGSNGGLLVGACMTQRPDLFGASLPAVGVMDMLRFHQFTAGRFWVDDYGSSDDREEFRALLAYSPYHNLKANTNYPATLITTADTDDRVVPGHSFKFAARLQEMQSGKAPVLIRIETRAGHGAGKPTEKIIEEIADRWAFLVRVLEMKL